MRRLAINSLRAFLPPSGDRETHASMKAHPAIAITTLAVDARMDATAASAGIQFAC